MTAKEFMIKKMEELQKPLPDNYWDIEIRVGLVMLWLDDYEQLQAETTIKINTPMIGYRSTSTGEVCDE